MDRAGNPIGYPEALPGFKFKPEVGELIGESILARHIVRSQIAGTYQQRIRFFFYFFHENRNVRSKMLSIGIYSDGISVAGCFGLLQSVL